MGDMYRWLILAALGMLTVWIYAFPMPQGLTVSFLDVGQGDAIFITGPTGLQVLIDGGATRAIARELSQVMPFFDRSIDAVIATHPDQDHIGGLIEVFERYDVSHYLESGNAGDSAAFHALERAIDAEAAARLLARRGMRLILGATAYADILFPDRDVSGVESNTASIIMRVVYGDTEFLLTGDAPQSVERYLVTTCTRALSGYCTLRADVLKAGHHGSKTSSDESFIRAVAPSFVVFSRGCDNRYGHPSPEVVERFKSLSVPSLDTCEDGTITFRSDGKTLRVEH